MAAVPIDTRCQWGYLKWNCWVPLWGLFADNVVLYVRNEFYHSAMGQLRQLHDAWYIDKRFTSWLGLIYPMIINWNPPPLAESSRNNISNNVTTAGLVWIEPAAWKHINWWDTEHLDTVHSGAVGPGVTWDDLMIDIGIVTTPPPADWGLPQLTQALAHQVI